MIKKHKLGRTQAIRAAFENKRESFLNKRFEVKQAHNFGGKAFERCEYNKKLDKVTVYDAEGKEVESISRSKKVQDTSKLPKTTDGKLRKSTEQ